MDSEDGFTNDFRGDDTFKMIKSVLSQGTYELFKFIEFFSIFF